MSEHFNHCTDPRRFTDESYLQTTEKILVSKINSQSLVNFAKIYLQKVNIEKCTLEKHFGKINFGKIHLGKIHFGKGHFVKIHIDKIHVLQKYTLENTFWKSKSETYWSWDGMG